MAAGQAAWLIEREEAVARLRWLCEEFGDQDWDDNLHLADVIDKHLGRYLYEAERDRGSSVVERD